VIKGHDFNSGRDIDLIMSSMLTTGFQATSLGQAVEEINRMVRKQPEKTNNPVASMPSQPNAIIGPCMCCVPAQPVISIHRRID
jgi:deoxyhypusine synthase